MYVTIATGSICRIHHVAMIYILDNSHSRCEQSCPVHFAKQEHLLGAMHLPFTHDGEQTAAVKKRHMKMKSFLVL